jgi:hypothetical protein
MSAAAEVVVAVAVPLPLILLAAWLWFRGLLPGSPHERGCATARWYTMGVATGMLNPGVVLWYAKRHRLCQACSEKLTTRLERPRSRKRGA